MRTVSHITRNFESHLKALPSLKTTKNIGTLTDTFGINKKQKTKHGLKLRGNHLTHSEITGRKSLLRLQRDFECHRLCSQLVRQSVTSLFPCV